jgi:hypothetical protein
VQCKVTQNSLCLFPAAAARKLQIDFVIQAPKEKSRSLRARNGCLL